MPDGKLIKNKFLRVLAEWALAIAIALLVFFLLNTFVAQSSRIYGNSMEPTLSHNDRVVVNRLVYLFSEPTLDDIIAFTYAANPGHRYIKRIVGLPGDVMDMRGGFVYRNDARLDDAFVDGPVMHGNVAFPMIVPPDTFFVLGDNRRVSEDSRFIDVGNVPRDDIIGRVRFRWVPFGSFGFVE